MNIKRIIYAVPFALATALGMPFSAVAAPSDWAGLYAGLNGGYAQDKNVTLDVMGISSNSFDMTGWVAGGQVGYNWATGKVVVGIQADASAADVSGSTLCAAGFIDTCKAKMDQLFKIQGRVGFPINNFLIYGALGAASAQIEATDSFVTGSLSETSYQTGWLAGIGGAMAFANHWNGFVEAQYLNFGTNDYNLGGTPVSVENKFVTLNVGVNYKF